MLFQEAYSKHKVTNKQKVKAYTVQTISIKKLLWLSFRKYKPGVLLETKSFFFLVMIKRLIYQENVTVLNVYTLINKAAKYLKPK